MTLKRYYVKKITLDIFSMSNGREKRKNWKTQLSLKRLYSVIPLNATPYQTYYELLTEIQELQRRLKSISSQ